MFTLEEIRNNKNLINEIDWDMTPEEAVRLYLEWGNNWASGNYVIRSPKDVSHYFVLNTWGDRPKIYLVKRNSEKAEEIAEFHLPENLEKQCQREYGKLKGVFALEGDIKDWLKSELNQ